MEVERAGGADPAGARRVGERLDLGGPAVVAALDVVGEHLGAVGGEREVVGEPAALLERGVGGVAQAQLDRAAGVRRQVDVVVPVAAAVAGEAVLQPAEVASQVAVRVLVGGDHVAGLVEHLELRPGGAAVGGDLDEAVVPAAPRSCSRSTSRTGRRRPPGRRPTGSAGRRRRSGRCSSTRRSRRCAARRADAVLSGRSILTAASVPAGAARPGRA